MENFTLLVPGLVGNKFNSVVGRYGVEVVKESSDFVKSKEHERAQDYAYSFAETYNRKLLKYLVKTKLPRANSPITRELRRLEVADVEADAQTALKKRDFRLLRVYGLSSRPTGIPPNELKSVQQRETRVIGQSMRGSKEPEVKQLSLIARSYAGQYNTYLLRHLGEYKKH